MVYYQTTKTKAFTLVEMLIVIVIIGILVAALIPRVTNAQARARDTARDVDLRTTASAIDLYYADNGGYPAPNYTAATNTRQVGLRDLLIPTAYANTLGSSLSSLEGSLSNYLKSIPRDPRGQGVKAAADGSCVNAGDSYGYYSSGAMYAITSISEREKGNASSCGNTINRAGDGGYKKEGVGLIYMCDYAAPPSGCNYTAGPSYDPVINCGMILNCGVGEEELPYVCQYPAPPSNCNYIPGPSYDPITNCGMILNCF